MSLASVKTHICFEVCYWLFVDYVACYLYISIAVIVKFCFQVTPLGSNVTTVATSRQLWLEISPMSTIRWITQRSM